MGATDVLPQCKSSNIVKETTLEVYIGDAKLKIGVDGSVLIHMALDKCREDILLRQDWTSFAAVLRTKFEYLKRVGPNVEWIVVLDGHRISAKLVNEERTEVRNAAMKIVDNKWDNDEMPTKSEMSAAVGAKVITAAEVFYRCQKALGITVRVAPGEAEHQLVSLQLCGLVTHILCNDSDYMLLGGTNLIFVHHTLRGKVHIFTRDVFENLTSEAINSSRDKIRSERGRRNKTEVKRFEPSFFALLCGNENVALSILLVYSAMTGTDYGSIKGIGTKKAQEIIVRVTRSRSSACQRL